MSSFYVVPSSGGTVASVKSTVLASGVALLFVYLVALGLGRCTMCSRRS
jgi:hypothetical protein